MRVGYSFLAFPERNPLFPGPFSSKALPLKKCEKETGHFIRLGEKCLRFRTFKRECSLKTSKSRKLPADLHPLLRPGFGHHHTLPPSAGHSALSEESEQILHRHGHVRHRFEHGPSQARQERGKAHPFRLLLLDGYRRSEPGNAKDSRDLVILSSNLLS